MRSFLRVSVCINAENVFRCCFDFGTRFCGGMNQSGIHAEFTGEVDGQDGVRGIYFFIFVIPGSKAKPMSMSIPFGFNIVLQKFNIGELILGGLYFN